MVDKEWNIDIKAENKVLMDHIIGDLRDSGILNYVSAVIISGSFGRDEPTYVIDDNGNICYRSDIEMVLVYDDWPSLVKIKKNKQSVIAKYDWIDLELMPISKSRLLNIRNHNYSLLTTSKKTLFTFDFYNGSKTIFGRDYLNNTVNIKSVDLFEGKRIIANRVAELCYLYKYKKIDNEEIDRWKAKILMSIGTAVLLNNGLYVSSYKDQFKLLKDKQHISNGVLGSSFIRDYSWAFEYLRCGIYGKITCSDEQLRSYVKAMYQFYKDALIDKSKTGCLYIIIREALLLLKYDLRLYKYILNPKELILDNVMKCYIENSKDVYRWAEAWKKVLN